MKLSLQRLFDAWLWLQSLTGLAALLFLMFVGSFSRYWADDFCYVSIVQNAANLFDAVRMVYVTWSNRYTNVLLVGLLSPFGAEGMRFFPALMIALLALALFAALRSLSRFWGQPMRPLLAANLALLLTFFSILQTPNRFQSVYWMMGLVTYFAPVVFLAGMAALIAWLARPQPLRKAGLLALALLAFLAGGLSETTLALQVTCFSLALSAAVFWKKKALWAPLGLALAVSLLALLVVFLAPGNTVRMNNIPESQFSVAKIPLIFIFAFDFILNSLRSFMLPALMSLLAAFGLGLALFDRQPSALPRPWLGFGLLALTTYTLIASLVAPSVYVYGEYGYPEPRALFPAQFVLSAALMTLGVLLARQAAPWLGRQAWFSKSFGLFAVSALFLLVSAYPLWFLYREAPSLAQLERYAQTWDERDAFLRSQRQGGTLDVRLDGIQPPGGLIDLRQSPGFWVNACVADFYDLDTIAVFP